MSELVQIVNNQAVVSSRQIAENFGKEHGKVIRSIEDILGQANFGDTPMFFGTTYVHEQNKQEYPEYLMNRDGFSLLVMGFTGKQALEWKIKYIKAFNEMESRVKQLSPLEILAAQAQALVDQDRQMKEIRQEVRGIREIVALNSTDWRRETAMLISKMSRSLHGDYSGVQDLRSESYKLLDDRMGVDLKIRVTYKRRRLAEEGVCKSKRDALNALDVIGDDKKLIEGYVAIIKEMAIKYGVQEVTK